VKITEQRLKEIIREEYLGKTPTRRGEIMTEERARYLSNRLVNEVGLFSTLGAMIKGAFSGGKTAAGGTLALPVKGVVRIGQAIAQAGSEAAAAIKGIKDATVKAYAEKVKEALTNAIKAEITKSAGQLMKALVKTGLSEQEATAETTKIMTSAVTAATGTALKGAEVPGGASASSGGAAAGGAEGGDKAAQGGAAAGGAEGGGKAAQGGAAAGGTQKAAQGGAAAGGTQKAAQGGAAAGGTQKAAPAAAPPAEEPAPAKAPPKRRTRGRKAAA